MKSKIDTIENWFDRVWTKEDKTAIREIFVPEDPEDLAHASVWPWGRGNHFLFDLRSSKSRRRTGWLGRCKGASLPCICMQLVRTRTSILTRRRRPSARAWTPCKVQGVWRGSRAAEARTGCRSGSCDSASCPNRVDALRGYDKRQPMAWRRPPPRNVRCTWMSRALDCVVGAPEADVDVMRAGVANGLFGLKGSMVGRLNDA